MLVCTVKKTTNILLSCFLLSSLYAMENPCDSDYRQECNELNNDWWPQKICNIFPPNVFDSGYRPPIALPFQMQEDMLLSNLNLVQHTSSSKPTRRIRNVKRKHYIDEESSSKKIKLIDGEALKCNWCHILFQKHHLSEHVLLTHLLKGGFRCPLPGCVSTLASPRGIKAHIATKIHEDLDQKTKKWIQARSDSEYKSWYQLTKIVKHYLFNQQSERNSNDLEAKIQEHLKTMPLWNAKKHPISFFNLK